MTLGLRTFTVFCPDCREPVLIALDTRIPISHKQIWDCPHCSHGHIARFDAKIVGVIVPSTTPTPVEIPKSDAPAKQQ